MNGLGDWLGAWVARRAAEAADEPAVINFYVMPIWISDRPTEGRTKAELERPVSIYWDEAP